MNLASPRATRPAGESMLSLKSRSVWFFRTCPASKPKSFGYYAQRATRVRSEAALFRADQRSDRNRPARSGAFCRPVLRANVQQPDSSQARPSPIPRHPERVRPLLCCRLRCSPRCHRQIASHSASECIASLFATIPLGGTTPKLSEGPLTVNKLSAVSLGGANRDFPA